VTVKPNAQATLNVKIEAPTGRRYADQMVDNPRMCATPLHRIFRARSCRQWKSRCA